MRTLLALALLFAVALAQASDFNTDIDVSGKKTLTFLGGLELDVDVKQGTTVRVDPVVDLAVDIAVEGYNLLLGDVEAAVGFKITFTPEGNLISASLKSPTLSLTTVTSLLASVTGNVAGAVRFNVEAEAYTWIDATDYNFGDLNVVVDVPGSGQYSFIARSKDVPIVRLYQEVQAITDEVNQINFGNELTVVIDAAAGAAAEVKGNKLLTNPTSEDPEGELKGLAWFEFDVSGSADKVNDATLDYTYKEEDLAKAGIEEAGTLKWYHYDESSSSWTESPSTANSNAKTVTTTSSEFVVEGSGSSKSKFALYAEISGSSITASASSVAVCFALMFVALVALLL